MKPSITIDERGILLHVTDSEGRGVAVPLDAAGLAALAGAVTQAIAKLKTKEGRSVLFKGVGEILRTLTTTPTKEESRNETPETDPDRDPNR